MTDYGTPSDDRSALVYRYHERLYRLALLVAGDARAAAGLVEQAYRQLPAGALDAENTLVRALLAGRPARRWRWSARDADLGRAGLDTQQADGLLGLLARMTPVARLVVGLHYIAGSAPAEIAAQLGQSAGDQPVVELLARFRLDAARDLGCVPAGADSEQLGRLDRAVEGLLGEEAALELRRALFEQARMRELRDGLAAARELLPRAIPALFAAMPPVSLTERLLAYSGRRQLRAPQLSARRAQVLLAAGVLALAAAIVLVPSLLAGRAAPTARRAPNAQELVEASIHRFGSAPLQAGVLHEQYRVERAGRAALLIERWYDYATPNRLAIRVNEEGQDAPLVQISSDGRALVQFRVSEAAGQPYAADARVTEDEARAVLPLLRGQPDAGLFRRGPNQTSDPGPAYLALARASDATLLGQTSMLGRPAYLVTYRTGEPPLAARQRSSGQPVQVVLTIDAQTYALLDVAVLPEGAAEGTARHPLQAIQFEVQASVPEQRFYLPTGPDVTQQDGIASVRLPSIAGASLMTLEDAARRSTEPLLAPRQLPDDQMRGLAVAINRADAGGVALVYEGEFQSVLVVPNDGASLPEGTGEERSAGEFRYRLLPWRDSAGGITALAYRPDAPERRVMVMLNDAIATPPERESRLQAVIASLTPVDPQTLPVLRRNFQTPRATAGGS